MVPVSSKKGKTKFIIWKPTLNQGELITDVISLRNNVLPGPSDPQIRVVGFDIEPNQDGDFLPIKGQLEYSNEELEAINSYVTVRSVLNTFQKLAGKEINWVWNNSRRKDPLKIFTRSPDVASGYSSNGQALEFAHYRSGDQKISHSHSTDIIAHETTHAILESLRPGWYPSLRETAGVMEGICDLTAMFFKLSRKDWLEEMLLETNGDLTRPNILTQFGLPLGKDGTGMRSALSDSQLTQGMNQYQQGEVLTGAIYSILVNYYSANCKVSRDQGLDFLLECGREIFSLIFKCILKSREEEVSFSEFGELFLQLCSAPLSEISFREFKFRKII